ncbi:potassium uptake protein, integral membrane component, KtrB [Aquipluma nitroreducens]|uniref:Potassium uptake protein, integral membrane component, KtrB n=1 Tax=Aquipluma nitroreducens TaxID=2010828 RepID=A0A5K7S750_9BACT|nr:potassium transporter TrkG [Aquipluma nitroreducens]BBE17366.1 potassium uptake protein, integral membrane component, KtrB [Aquipluma nitroreducens]
MARKKNYLQRIDFRKDLLSLKSIINWILFGLTFGLFILAIRDIGFPNPDKDSMFQIHNRYFQACYILIGVLYMIRSIFFRGDNGNRKVFITQFVIGIILVLFFLPVFIVSYGDIFEYYLYRTSGIQMFAFFLFFLELSRMEINLLIKILNPAQLFMVSFAFIISAGAMLLMMPMSTTSPIDFTDALFTSTSAVCVTGLTVVDTATRYTFLGKFIILALIQIGGIGVMTITSFFGIFFKEKSSLREQTMLRDYLSEDSFDVILKSLMKVVLITLLIEAIGATFVYFSLEENALGSVSDNLKFSIFHAVSAFCNAGFSTLTDNLYDVRIRTNYNVHFWIANLIVLGGIGFPVLLNLYQYCKSQIVWLAEYFRTRKSYVHRVNMITLNSKIVIFSTFVLIVSATVAFMYFEWDHTQQGMDFKARLASSYFQSVTPRTAGFNSFSMAALSMPTILIMTFLMWVGASPVSTGGGIKTSTFALAILNAYRIIRGKNHIEVHRYEIHEYSVNKAFAIITLSIFIILFGAFAIFTIDGQFGMFRIIFECFSAFGTVGLSLDLTPNLSAPSKYILIVLMYVGRMGSITLLLSLAKGFGGSSLYRYPKENLIIT